MTHLVSSTPPLAAAHCVKRYPGHGILGAAIPATGATGGSPVLNDGLDPAKRYAWRVATPPAGGTLTIYPDLSYDHVLGASPNGTYPWTYQLLEDGQVAGTAVVSDHFGPLEAGASLAPSTVRSSATSIALQQTHLIAFSSSEERQFSAAIELLVILAGNVALAPSKLEISASGVGLAQEHLIGFASSQVTVHADKLSVEARLHIGRWIIETEVRVVSWTSQDPLLF